MPGLVVYKNRPRGSAIEDYSRHLVGALCDAGAPARYVAGGLGLVRRDSAAPGWVLLQYNPNSYGRRGFAPALLRDAVAVRRRWPAMRFAVMVHEAWVSMRDWRSAVMGSYQRVQLRILLRLAQRVLVSREALVRELGARAIHVPVAATVTPVGVSAGEARARLNLADEFVVALFGTANPERALDHAAAAVAALARRPGAGRICVLNLGRDAPAFDAGEGVEVRTPGRLDPAALSLRLRASDVLLVPFHDGVSTRRTTMMAGFAHGLPVVGLRGANTDRVLLEHPDAIALTPAGDPASYARATVALAQNAERRRRLGEAGRRLYTEQFDWPLVARRVIAALGLGGRER